MFRWLFHHILFFGGIHHRRSNLSYDATVMFAESRLGDVEKKNSIFTGNFARIERLSPKNGKGTAAFNFLHLFHMSSINVV